MDKRITIPLPDELHRRLKARAEINKRTLTSQIIWELEQTIKPDEWEK